MNIVMKTSAVLLMAAFLIPLVGVNANPIPVPTIIMPDEHIKIMFTLMNGEYYAVVDGSYPFKNVGYKHIIMYYPIPNESKIRVMINGNPVEWSYTNRSYPTVIGNYSMISWVVENPAKNFTVDVIYMQRLVRRSNGSTMFLYALGTGKYLEYYAKQTTAYVDITSQFPVDRYQVYFDNDLNKSVELGKPIHDKIIVKSGMFKPLTKDLLIVFNPLNPPSINVKFSTDKSVYDVGKLVKIILKNYGDKSIYLPNTAPWEIRNGGGKTIYSPVASQVVTEVKPGEEEIWIWDQRNYNGNQVPPDTYIILLHVMRPEATLQHKFEIIYAMPQMPKPKFNGTLYIKVYPDKVKLNFNVTVKSTENYGVSTAPNNITVLSTLSKASKGDG